MNQEQLLAQCLEEVEGGTSTPQGLLARYPWLRKELEPLLWVHRELADLPQNITLSATAKARIRAQLLAEVRQSAPVRSFGSWWGSVLERSRAVFLPQGLGGLLARPAGVALSVLLGFGLLGVGTVSAAMESVPGDGLYPVKMAAEQTRLALALTDRDRAETYLWIASSRVDELSKISEAGKLELAPRVVTEYEHNVAQALRLSAAQKEEEGKLHQQVARIQTSLQEVYEKAPQALQVMLAQTLTLASTGSAQLNSGPAAVPEGPASPGASGMPPASDPSSGSTVQPNTSTTSSSSPSVPLPAEKGGVSEEPPPSKGGPLSTPPLEPDPGLPPKGNIGPPAGPVPGKDMAAPPPAGPAPEPGKSEPVPPAAGTSPGDTPISKEGSGALGIQGGANLPPAGIGKAP